MKRTMRLILLSFVGLLSLFSFSVAGAQGACNGLPTPRLLVGGTGRVVPGGSANNMRSQPDTDAGRVGTIQPGGEFAILDGPVCADDYVWWQVDHNGLVGWTVEGDSSRYWLELLRAPEPTAVPVVVEAPDASAAAQTVTGKDVIAEGIVTHTLSSTPLTEPLAPQPVRNDCPVTVRIRLDELLILDPEEADGASFAGGDEAFMSYGINVNTREEFDFGDNNRFIYEWDDEVYGGSRVTGYPVIARIVSCEDTVQAMVYLVEDDALLGSSELGVVLSPISLGMSQPETRVEVIEGATYDGPYAYQVTYTVDLKSGAGEEIDGFAASGEAIRVDDSSAEITQDLLTGAAVDAITGGLSGGSGSGFSSGPCELAYGMSYSAPGYEEYTYCTFEGRAGDVIAVEGTEISVISYLTAPDGSSVRDEGGIFETDAYTLPATGVYNLTLQWLSYDEREIPGTGGGGCQSYGPNGECLNMVYIEPDYEIIYYGSINLVLVQAGR